MNKGLRDGADNTPHTHTHTLLTSNTRPKHVVSVTVRPLCYQEPFPSPAQWIRSVLTQSITFTQLSFGFASKALERVQNDTHLASWMLRFFELWHTELYPSLFTWLAVCR